MSGQSRRQTLLGGLTLAAAGVCAPKPVLADPTEALPPIDERNAALERRRNAYVGVFAVDLDGGRSISHRCQ
jgi:beta-lactamase class A